MNVGVNIHQRVVFNCQTLADQPLARQVGAVISYSLVVCVHLKNGRNNNQNLFETKTGEERLDFTLLSTPTNFSELSESVLVTT